MHQGDVFRLPYLWRHEKARGRKRPAACLLVSARPLAYLYPITSTMPPPVVGRGSRIFLVLPDNEAHRVNQPENSVLILDEVNICREDELRLFENLDPLGSFSPIFVDNTARLALATLKANWYSGVA